MCRIKVRNGVLTCHNPELRRELRYYRPDMHGLTLLVPNEYAAPCHCIDTECQLGSDDYDESTEKLPPMNLLIEVPFYNEEESIEPLCNAIKEGVEGTGIASICS